MAIKLFNSGFSRQYIALDPTVPSGYGLRAANVSDIPLLFTVTNTTDSFQRFQTTVAGSDLCLDVYGDQSTIVHLATCGTYLGQQWWWSEASGGARLSNNYTGAGWYLDVTSGSGQVFMSSGEFLGQYWTQLDADAEVATSSAPVSITFANLLSRCF